jgi:hypothetical protein
MKISGKLTIIITTILIISASLLFGLNCSSPQAAKANQPPVIQQIVGPTAWIPGSSAQITCLASDPDGDKLTYTWTADNGTIDGKGPTITWAAPLGMGKYNVSVVVSDGKGGEVKSTTEESVVINDNGSVNPDAVILRLSVPSKDVITATKRIRIWMAASVECVVSGANVQNAKYSWTASNGRLQAKGLSEGTASKVNWIAPGAAGDYTLDVVVTDGNNETAKGTVTFTVFCCGN